jgi:hypothetical protein
MEKEGEVAVLSHVLNLGLRPVHTLDGLSRQQSLWILQLLMALLMANPSADDLLPIATNCETAPCRPVCIKQHGHHLLSVEHVKLQIPPIGKENRVTVC